MSDFLPYIPETLPTYVEKYRVGGGDLYRAGCFAKILCRDYTGGMSYLKGYGHEPIEVSFNFADSDYFKSIGGSSCTLKILSEGYAKLLEFAEADDTKYIVQVWDEIVEGETKSKKMIFTGYLKPETYLQEYGAENCMVQVTATDGLGMLKFIKFRLRPSLLVEYAPLNKDHLLKDVLSYLLYLAGNRDNWYDMVPYRAGEIPGILFTGFLNVSLYQFFEEDCYTVLTELLSLFRLQLCMSAGKYVVRLVDDPNISHIDIYTYRGVFVETIEASRIEVDMYSVMKGLIGDLRAERPLKSLIFQTKKKAYSNLLYNGNFEDGKIGWNYSSGFNPANWNVGYNEMVLTHHPPQSEFKPWVFANFGRGPRAYSAWCTVRVQLQTKYYSSSHFGSYGDDTEWTFEVAINDEKKVYTAKGSDWQTLEEDFLLKTSDGDAVIKIYSNLGGETSFGYPRQGFKNIRIFAVNTLMGSNFEPIPNEDSEEEIIIGEGSLEEKDIEIKAFYTTSGTDLYRYENLTSIMGVTHDTTGVQKYMKQAIMDRYVLFHSAPRLRISLKGIKNQELEILPHMLLFDKFFKKIYTILQYSYQVIGKVLSLECMEFEEKIEDTPSVPYDDWILVTGFWNDSGVWRDNKYWIDSL